jgi:glycerol-3-phosphate dehydrogenase (NAD(P)+)
MQITILGAGSWGSSLAIAVSEIANVVIWTRNIEQVKIINQTHTNGNYLPKDIKFSSKVVATSDLANSIHNSSLIIIATPTNALRQIMTQIAMIVNKTNIPDLIWVCKGIEQDTALLPHQIIKSILPNYDNYGGLLGPSFAHEVAYKMPTAMVLTSYNSNFVKKWINTLQNITNLRIYANHDVIGVELCSGFKNIFAIATGLSDGLGFGNNARAALITRGLHELHQVIIAYNGDIKSMYGLAGIGDLILTCTSDLSRNRRVGLQLATGDKVVDIIKNLKHVSEGFFTLQEAYKLQQKLNIELPITQALYQIIYQDANIIDTIKQLMRRPHKTEY